MNNPGYIISGDKATLQSELAASAVTYKAYFKSQDSAAIVTGTASSSGVTYNLTADNYGTDSGELAPGDYEVWFFGFDVDGNRTLISKIALRIEPDPASTTYTPKSAAELIMADLDAVISRRASDGVLERTVDGITLKYATFTELYCLREKYRAIVDQEHGEVVLPGSILTRNGRF